MKTRKMKTLQQKKARYGYLFILPLLFGMVVLFGIPVVESLVFSLSNVHIDRNGFSTTWNGLGNYYEALFVETGYREKVVNSILNMLLNVPLIVIFSFFMANLLNQKFHGRWLARVVLCLPLVLASSALLSFDSGDILQAAMGSAAGNLKESQSLLGLQSQNLGELLITSGILPTRLAEYLMTAADRIYEIILYSGVQILIFLAALQSVPRDLYEVASMEGASAWEAYWKITFPMVSPILVTVVIYTIIDSFVISTNQTLETIQTTAFTKQLFGLSAAMAWVYFLLILIIIGVVYYLLSRMVKKYDK